MQGFLNNKMPYILNPLFNNSSQTSFQGGTKWVTQILNNVIVSMVP